MTFLFIAHSFTMVQAAVINLRPADDQYHTTPLKRSINISSQDIEQLIHPENTVIHFMLSKGQTYRANIIDHSVNNKGFHIVRAQMEGDSDISPRYASVFLVINPQTARVTGHANIRDMSLTIVPGENGSVHLLEEETTPEGEFDIAPTAAHTTTERSADDADRKAVDGNTDMIHTIDVLIGFSQQAYDTASDPDLLAHFLIEYVNNALINSEVYNARLHLTGTAVTPHNPGAAGFSDITSYFQDDIRTLQPDIVSMIQIYVPSDGTTIGLGLVGGYVNHNVLHPRMTQTASIFAHEVGHNAGSGHCPGSGHLSGYPYAHGYQIPELNKGTYMCRSGINLYSNPAIQYEGHTIGNETTANMARVWRERAQIMSRHRVKNSLVNTTEDNLENDGLCSLREALDNDNNYRSGQSPQWPDCSTDGGQIRFSNSLTGQTIPLQNPLEIHMEMDLNLPDITIQQPDNGPAFIINNSYLRLSDGKVTGIPDSRYPIIDVISATVDLKATMITGGYIGVLTREGHVSLDNNAHVHQNSYGLVAVDGRITLDRATIENNAVAGITTLGAKVSRVRMARSSINNNGKGIVAYSSHPSSRVDINVSTIARNGLSLDELSNVPLDIPTQHEGSGSGSGSDRDHASFDIAALPGAGIYTKDEQTLWTRQTTISGNYGEQGAGIYIDGDGSRFGLEFVTLADNEASAGAAGLFVAGKPRNATFHYNIFASQRAGTNCQFETALPVRTSVHFNLIDDHSCPLRGFKNIIGEPALLGPLADNGEDTLTHALLPGSPAIDAAEDCCCPWDKRSQRFETCNLGAVPQETASTQSLPTVKPTPHHSGAEGLSASYMALLSTVIGFLSGALSP